MISENLVDSIKRHEGFSSTVYRCASNVLTLGYGRAVDPDEEGTGITEEEAEMLLENDLKRFEEFTKDVLGDTWHVLNQVRREALTARSCLKGALEIHHHEQHYVRQNYFYEKYLILDRR